MRYARRRRTSSRRTLKRGRRRGRRIARYGSSRGGIRL